MGSTAGGDNKCACFNVAVFRKKENEHRQSPPREFYNKRQKLKTPAQNPNYQHTKNTVIC